VCFLLNLATDLDEDFAEVNINDLVETTVSAFAQLLLSKNKMKVSPGNVTYYYYYYYSYHFFQFYSLSVPYLEVLSNQGFYSFEKFE
jgi:hypothetical protein